MPVLPSNKHKALQSDKQYIRMYLSILPRITIWRARVNNATIEKGATVIEFDNGSPVFGTGLDFDDIAPFQTMYIGSAIGADDIGRTRVKAVSSTDSGVTGTVTVAGHSWEVEDNQHLTFVHLYELNPRFSYLQNDDNTLYKDDDLAYEDVDNPNQHPYPIPVVGPNRAAWKVGGSAVFDIDMTESYAMDVGRTITSYAAEVTPSSGVTVSITGGVGTITFTLSGDYWVKFSVTDSNGKTQETYRWFAVHDDLYQPFKDFQAQNLSGSWDTGGYEFTFDAFGDTDVVSIPDGTPVILWGETYYDDELDPIGFLPEPFDHILFSGYIQNQQIRHDRSQGTKSVSFTCVTPNAVLENVFMYSLLIEVADPVENWHHYDKHLTVGRGVHFVLQWHSTAIHVCDVIGLLNKIVYRRYFEYTEGGMHSMINSISYEAGTRERLICDNVGRFHFVEDLQLRNDEDRAAAVTIAEIDDRDLGPDPVEIVHEDVGSTAAMWVSAIAYDGVGVGIEGAEAFFSIAPGLKPAERGSTVGNKDRQTVVDQQETNEIAGRFWSRDRNPHPEVRLSFHGHYFNVLCPWLMEWWLLKLDGVNALRLPLEWQNPGKKVLCRAVDASFIYEEPGFVGKVVTNAVFEPEAPPMTGVTYVYPELPEIPPPPTDIPPPPPPPTPGIGDGFGTVYVMDPAVLYRTRDFSASPPNWTNILNTITGFKQDFILDPWYPTKVGFCVADTGIWRSIDLDTDNPTFSLVLSAGAIASAIGLNVSTNLLPFRGSINMDGFFCFPVVGTQTGPTVQRLHIIRTFDRGDTWDFRVVASTPTYSSIDTIGNTMEVVPHVIDGALRIFTTVRTLNRGYIMRSDDTGETWYQASMFSDIISGTPRFSSMNSPYQGNESGDTLWLSHLHPGTATGLRGYAVSHDGGVSWTKTTATSILPYPHRTGVDTFTQNKDQVVRANSMDLYVSTNEGSSWELRHTFPTDGLGDRITALGGFPYNGDQFYVLTSTKVWVSIDGGYNFEDKTGSMIRSDTTAAGTGREIATSVVVPVWVSE